MCAQNDVIEENGFLMDISGQYVPSDWLQRLFWWNLWQPEKIISTKTRL